MSLMVINAKKSMSQVAVVLGGSYPGKSCPR